jgi:hypothetical protein
MPVQTAFQLIASKSGQKLQKLKINTPMTLMRKIKRTR